MSDFNHMFDELDALRPPDRILHRISLPAARFSTAARWRPAVRLALVTAGVVLLIAALALAAHSRTSAPAPSNQPITADGLLAAMKGHGFVHVQRDKGYLNCDGMPADALKPRLSVTGELDVHPLTLPGDTGRTLATLAVVRSPADARRCARTVLQHDLRIHTPGAVMLSPTILKFLGTPHTEAGVTVDGQYEIFGSVGRIVYYGLAVNRPEAQQVEQHLRAAATPFAP